jgi:hypothetical protein
MKGATGLISIFIFALLAGCATTEFKTFEGNNVVVEGNGGTKVVVDGMEIWDNGDPPRKFKLLGIIDDDRPGGIVPMAQLKSDIVKRARQAGGDAVIQLRSQSQIEGYFVTGNASASSSGNNVSAHGSAMAAPLRRNVAQFAVIKYVSP